MKNEIFIGVAMLCAQFVLAHGPHLNGNPRNDRAPNIIYIFADDLGYGDLGCFGATDIKTPNIDRMAAMGIKFTQFYSAASVCSPSRAGLLTGRYPQRMGINQVFFPESYTGMSPSEITIAEMLKQKNYATGIVGKWHLGHREKFLPLQQGFDSYFGIPYSNDMRSVVYMEGNEVVDYDVDQHYTTKTYTERALKFIDQKKGSPFFLYLAHSMPHVPIYTSKNFEGTSNRGLYGDVIQEIDWSVGQILDLLETLDLMENTLVIFSSDNGPWLVMEDHGGSAGPLREGKQFTFDGGMRVPTIALWKGKIPPGTVNNDLATQMDWFPTIAQLTGSELPTDRIIDGQDISKVLFNTGKRNGDTFLYFDGSELQCFQQGDWKVKKPYNGYNGSAGKKAVVAHDTLLFNLKIDMGEKQDLHSKNPEKTKELWIAMEKAYASLGPLPKSLNVGLRQDNSHYNYLEVKHDKQQVEKIKNTLVQMWDAIEQGDVARYASFIHPSFTQFGENNPTLNIGKEVEVNGIRDWMVSSKNVHTEMGAPLVTIRGNTAWITYYWSDSGTSNGKPFASHGKSTRIFVNEHGRWLCIHGHYTLLP